MIEITREQEVLLRLPEPWSFLPRLAAEIRRDLPRKVSSMNDTQLLAETERSYLHASHALRVSHLPTLVRWTKTDVGSQGQLRRDPSADLYLRQSSDPNAAAADLLGSLAAQQRWPKEVS